MTDEERYRQALHAMQSGVQFEMSTTHKSPTEPKHLRVGVNTALVQHTAIVKLLLDKGVITMEEYWKTLADEMEAEVARYQERARQWSGRNGPEIRFG
jgi:hypothetical protein